MDTSHLRQRHVSTVPRKVLKGAIRTAKKKCWEDFCKKVGQDPWGRPYEAIMKKIKPKVGNMPTCPVFLDRVVPKYGARISGTGLVEFSETGALQDISEIELIKVAKKISIRKALIPRLELQVAVFATRLSKIVSDRHSRSLNEFSGATQKRFFNG